MTKEYNEDNNEDRRQGKQDSGLRGHEQRQMKTRIVNLMDTKKTSD